jgi:mannose-6-phosphate isomerase-like protein (cupin superfamily)
VTLRSPVVALTSLPRDAVVAHAGEGLVRSVRGLADRDFETNLQFVDYVEMPVGTSIGVHRHGDNEELYFLLEGEGVMTVDGREYVVRTGDLVLNRRGGTHGLRNESGASIRLLVWQVGV